MIYLVLQEIEEFLRDEFISSKYPLPGSEDLINIQIFLGALEHKEKGVEEFPYLLLDPVMGNIEKQTSPEIMDINIVLGLYSPDQKIIRGNMYLWQMMDRLRSSLVQNGLLKHAKLEYPLKWVTGNNSDKRQPYKYFFGMFQTKWEHQIAAYESTAEQNMEVFGDGYPGV